MTVLPELIIGPALVGGATRASRRWGAGVGGLVSAFPAVVGPVLLIAAHQRGAPFAARAATGTLLGIVALSSFALAYARVGVRSAWHVSLAAGWACAAIAAGAVAWMGHGVGLVAGLSIACASLLLAHRAMPTLRPDAGLDPGARSATDPGLASGAPGEVWLRVALTALLVASLTSLAAVAGPLVGGMLASLPVLSSVLAVFTHRRQGPAALVGLLRGLLAGMAGFVAFCAVVAALIVPAGVPAAFAAGTLAALGLQVLAVLSRPGPTGHRWGVPRTRSLDPPLPDDRPGGSERSS